MPITVLHSTRIYVQQPDACYKRVAFLKWLVQVYAWKQEISQISKWTSQSLCQLDEVAPYASQKWLIPGSSFCIHSDVLIIRHNTLRTSIVKTSYTLLTHRRFLATRSVSLIPWSTHGRSSCFPYLPKSQCLGKVLFRTLIQPLRLEVSVSFFMKSISRSFIEEASSSSMKMFAHTKSGKDFPANPCYWGKRGGGVVKTV